MEAEIGVTLPQAKELCKLSEAGRGERGRYLDFRLISTVMRGKLCCFKLLSFAAALGKEANSPSLLRASGGVWCCLHLVNHRQQRHRGATRFIRSPAGF